MHPHNGSKSALIYPSHHNYDTNKTLFIDIKIEIVLHTQRKCI